MEIVGYEVCEAGSPLVLDNGQFTKMGILNLYACIGQPEVEDEYLTRNSADFHEHMGFSKVGEFHKCGYKFGRWYNMIWMEKMIGKHSKAQDAISDVLKNFRICEKII